MSQSAPPSSDGPVKLASYPWYFDDWRGSEARAAMNGEERSLYRELLDHCWERGSLPNCPKTLQNLSATSRAEFKRSWPKVAEYFVLMSDDRYHHRKVDEKRPGLIGKKLERKRIAIKAGKASAESKAARQHDVERPLKKKSTEFNPSSVLRPPSTSKTSTPEVEFVSHAASVTEQENGTHSNPPPQIVIIPTVNTDPEFHGMMGAFLSLGVAISEKDTRKCAMLWVSLDTAAKHAAATHAAVNARGEWSRRAEEFVPRPWNYLRECQWERRAVAKARDRPMSKAEAGFTEGARMFMEGNRK